MRFRVNIRYDNKPTARKAEQKIASWLEENRIRPMVGDTIIIPDTTIAQQVVRVQYVPDNDLIFVELF